MKNSLNEAVRQEAIVAVEKLASGNIAEVINELSFQGVLFASKVHFTHDA